MSESVSANARWKRRGRKREVPVTLNVSLPLSRIVPVCKSVCKSHSYSRSRPPSLSISLYFSQNELKRVFERNIEVDRERER